MSSEVWFTSDQHFGHKGILTLGAGRPFATVEEHDVALIERWNAVVSPGDRVYTLGDFAFTDPAKIRHRLNGEIHMVWGNHDRDQPKNAKLFASARDYHELKVGDDRFVLFHYPLATWHWANKPNVYHLHGHSHQNFPEDRSLRRMDVGVDGHDFTPWNLDEVKERLKNRSGVPADYLAGAHQGDVVK